MIETLKDLWNTVSPAIFAAAKRGALVAAYMVVAAAIAAVEAYVSGRTNLDPSFLLIANLALAMAKRALEELRTSSEAE